MRKGVDRVLRGSGIKWLLGGMVESFIMLVFSQISEEPCYCYWEYLSAIIALKNSSDTSCCTEKNVLYGTGSKVVH